MNNIWMAYTREYMDLHILHPMVTSNFAIVPQSAATNQALEFEPLALFCLLEMMDGLVFHCGSQKN